MLRQLLGTPERVGASLYHVNPHVRGESLRTWCVSIRKPRPPSAWRGKMAAFGKAAYFLGDEGEASFEGSMTRGESTRFRVARGPALILDETRSSVDDYVDAFYLFQRALVDALRNGCPRRNRRSKI